MQFNQLKRRGFITLFSNAAAAWPLAARAQQPDRMRRIGALMAYAESDPEGQAQVAAFQEELQKLGWAEGRNIRIDSRWATPGHDNLQLVIEHQGTATTPRALLRPRSRQSSG
jgi:putative ABC transport system substrate-binding protein